MRKLITPYYKKLKAVEDNWVYRNYDEDSLFDPKSREGRRGINSIRTSIRVMIAMTLLALLSVLVFQSETLTFLAIFVLINAAISKGFVERKMHKGYPYLEPSDAPPMMLVFIIDVVLLVAWLFALFS